MEKSAHKLVFVHDRDGRIIDANRAYEERIGRPRSQIVGTPYWEVFPPRKGPLQSCQRILSGLEEMEEEEFLLETGELFLSRNFEIRDPQGHPLYFIHFLEDITEHLRIEEKNRRNAELLDKVFDSTEIIAAVLDREFNFVRVSRAYAAADNRPPEFFPGKNHFDLFPSDAELIFRRVVEMGEEYTARARPFVYAEHPERGTTYWDWTLHPIKEKDGSVSALIFILKNVTEQKKSEERFREEAEVTANLLRIAEASARTTDIDRLMESVLLLSHEILKSDVTVGYLWDPEMKTFVPCRAFGLPSPLLPAWRNQTFEGSEPFVQEAFRTREPRVTSVIPEELRFLPDLRTLALAPLVGKKGNLGIMGFLLRTSREFSDRDLRILRGVGHQLSAALEEARLYKASLDQAMRLSQLMEAIRVRAEIDRSILSALEPEEILETAVRMVARVIPCDRSAVILSDKEKTGLVYAAGFGITFMEKGASIPLEDTWITEVLRTGRPQYIPDLPERKDLPPLEARLLEEQFHTLLRVPLRVRHEGVGVLTVGARRPAAFTPEDVSTLEKFAGQVSVALSNARLLTDLRALFTGTVRTLSEAIDAKSPWTRGHSDRVAEYAVLIAREMGRPEKEVEDLRIAGWLHDVGKIGTYEYILDKPDRLTPEEYALVKEHTVQGVKVLASLPQIGHLLPWIRGHHEWWNGEGYPDGLREEAIPLQARILAVADSYDSMTAERPYRPTPGREWAMDELKRFAGIQFDPHVVEAFLKKVPIL